MPRSLLLLALLTLTPAVFAVDGPSTAKMPLDFELSDGHRFVTLAALPALPTVVNFWRADCPPCVREMPELAALARAGQVRVITVALQRPAETAAAPAAIQAALQPPLLSLHGPGEPRGLLARFGNRAGALPHTVILDTGRRACAQHTGEINRRWLAEALANCSKT
ncbi:thiol-disulfide isomerase/thioredoxin [Azonexus fungiphilus]|jgi:thiol-disulfide isomerase/thioredoxin|uniref:Thiol-disulfide isomerase/thioredoxin n=1 Tax=Azonexus fungiphilus TaxID=146940 RepID=A0A495WD29_9RHOO|nr:TlpA disulfide reductase family protein [Azonexus fungiphilus]NHC05887.1 TlpA family protein disulfide reductase [Azonexus fungiphilus]RKT59269.1 thiol-disulfide isomerase/thioredoxin [Azonexus fungiphilus]